MANEVTKESLWEKIEHAVDQLADVTVATLVTDVQVTVDDEGRITKTATPTTPIPAIITNMNLVTGDVSTEIGPSIKDDAALAAFHQQVVHNALRVLPDNITALAHLVEGIFGARSG
jgi:hypothetical protein